MGMVVIGCGHTAVIWYSWNVTQVQLVSDVVKYGMCLFQTLI